MKQTEPRILIIDDDPVNLRLCRAILERAKYLTCCAHDGFEGLDLFEKFQPQLVLSDILMPRLGGYDIVQRLRQHETSAHVHIIMMSTLTDPEDHQRAAECGADAFLQKPITHTELLECVQLLLSRPAPIR